jgi:hypothetical protein
MQATHGGGDETAGDGAGPAPEDLESILSEAVESGLPQRWLSWHYRSHDESLIAFSNRYYYDNKLSSLPSPGAREAAGISWRRVDGRFDRSATRTNEVEARAVLAEITRRLHDPATARHSIGVVTFNIQQRDLILNLLEESTDPVVREQLSGTAAEPVFVKNLENVQGDERDVVLFSLAFSTDPENGQLPLNFGPLSQAGGERRLNVAITRARRQVVLFSSFDPADIDLSRTAAVGTQHLRAYCELAAAGADRLGDLAAQRAQRRDRIRDEVADAIRARGHEVHTAHGLSDFTVDLAVRTPGSARWQVAVMLDSPEWSNRPTVADRDAAPTLLRTIMGWPQVVRFWLPAWIHDRSAVLDRIDAAVDAASIPDPEPPPEPDPAIPVPRQPRGASVEPTAAIGASGPSTAAPSGTTRATPFVPYQPTPLGGQSDLDAIGHDRGIESTVRAALREIIAAEGPIEQHRLARLTLARFGFAKTREDRRAAVLALVDDGVLRNHPAVGGFAWPTGLDPDTWRGFRTRSGVSADRAFEEVPPEEVVNALTHAAESRPGLGEEALLRAALELLGYRRKTDKIDRLLRYALHLAVTGGRIARRGDGRYELADRRGPDAR